MNVFLLRLRCGKDFCVAWERKIASALLLLLQKEFFSSLICSLVRIGYGWVPLHGFCLAMGMWASA